MRQSTLGLTVLFFAFSAPAAENFSRYQSESRSLLEIPTFIGDSTKADDTLIQAGSLGFERIRGKGPERVEKRAKDQVYLVEPQNEVVVASPKKVNRRPASDKNRQAKVKKGGRNYVLKMQPKFWRLLDLSNVAQARINRQQDEEIPIPTGVNGNPGIPLTDTQKAAFRKIMGEQPAGQVTPADKQALANAISKTNDNKLNLILQGDVTEKKNLIDGVNEAVAGQSNGKTGNSSNPGGGSPGGGAGTPGGGSNGGSGQNAAAVFGIAGAAAMMAGTASTANSAVQANAAQANGQVTQTAIKAGEQMHNASAAAATAMKATDAQVAINKMNQDGATEREGMKLASQNKAMTLNAMLETSKLMAKKSSDAAKIQAAALQSWVTTTIASMGYNTNLAIAGMATGAAPGGGTVSPYNGGRGPALTVKPKNAQIPGSYAMTRQPGGTTLNSQWQTQPSSRTQTANVGVKRSVSNRLVVSSKQAVPSNARGLTRTRTPSLADGSTADVRIRIPDTYAPIRTLASVPAAVAAEPHVAGSSSPGEYTRKIGPIESHSQEDEE